MKFLLCALLLVTSINAFAEKMGVGLMLGNPTGVNGKYWLNEDHAIDAGVGFSLGRNSDFSLHSDYLLHSKGAFFFNDVHPLDLYYGIGGRMEFGDDIELGVRAPVGIVHMFADQPADMFVEVAPILDFVGRTGLELHLAAGARYYFE